MSGGQPRNESPRKVLPRSVFVARRGRKTRRFQNERVDRFVLFYNKQVFSFNEVRQNEAI